MALLIVNCIFFEIKNNFFFLKHEFLYSEVCNFLRRFLVMLPAFLLPICLFFFFLFIRILNKVINEHPDCYLKADDTLLKITIRGLLIGSFEVLSVPRVR